jgi:hypothetical protein
MKKSSLLIIGAVIISIIAGCSPADSQWQAEHVTTLSGFKVPECAVYAPDSGLIYVSNIDCILGEYWLDNGTGHITVVGKNHRIQVEQLVKSEPSAVLHGPKGLCILGEHLYMADNARLMRCPLAGGKAEVVAEGFSRANDLCTDGQSVWVSDVMAGKIYVVSPEGEKREIKAPEGVNGITFAGEKMFGVSWPQHEVYELDPSGKKAPVAFGLAEHFTTLDGIEVLDDGTFIVSDFQENKVCTISPDRTTVKTLIETTTPADIGLNRKAGLLYVPLLTEHKLAVYRISKKR